MKIGIQAKPLSNTNGVILPNFLGFGKQFHIHFAKNVKKILISSFFRSDSPL